MISAASGWASWAVGAIGAKFYKSATPPPEKSPPAQDQSNPNMVSKEGQAMSTYNKSAPPNSNTFPTTSDVKQLERSQNAKVAARGIFKSYKYYNNYKKLFPNF